MGAAVTSLVKDTLEPVKDTLGPVKDSLKLKDTLKIKKRDERMRGWMSTDEHVGHHRCERDSDGRYQGVSESFAWCLVPHY